jgi:hypothetical protein
VALNFFAGHGATFGDVPYVVPVDAQFSTLENMPYELVPVETLIGELRRAKGVRIAILDACRDNAAERDLKRTNTRGGEISRGLAQVKNPDGLIIAYATQYLSTAADGDPSGDSPFTAALLNNLSAPGLDVKEMFYKTAREVLSKTKGRQRPEISISFYDSYALVPPTLVPTSHAPPTLAPPPPPGADETAWNFAQTSREPKVIEAFIAQFPTSLIRTKAEALLQELKLAALPPSAALPNPSAPATAPPVTSTVTPLPAPMVASPPPSAPSKAPRPFLLVPEKAPVAAPKQIGSVAAGDAFLAHHGDGFLADLAKAERQKGAGAGSSQFAAAVPAEPNGKPVASPDVGRSEQQATVSRPQPAQSTVVTPEALPKAPPAQPSASAVPQGFLRQEDGVL